MIICNDCGHVFDESEWGDYGECPSCNSTDTVEAWECPVCGEYHNGFFEGHLIWCCPECFQKALTIENFSLYATSGAQYSCDIDILEDFAMYELLDMKDDILKHSSGAFKELCKEVYDRYANSAFPKDRETLMDKIKDYFDRNPDCYTDFTDWMVKVYNGESTKVV